MERHRTVVLLIRSVIADGDQGGEGTDRASRMLELLVGAAGFEPTTSCTKTDFRARQGATRLRQAIDILRFLSSSVFPCLLLPCSLIGS